MQGLPERLQNAEASIIREALSEHGTVERTAAALRVSKRALAYKLKKYRRLGHLNPGSGHGGTGPLPVLHLSVTRVAGPLMGQQELRVAALPCCP